MAIKKSNTKANGSEFKYEVVEKCGVLSTNERGWSTELRYIAWNDKEPKYDIRSWTEDENGEKMGKGITLTGEELEKLYEIIGKLMEE